MSIFKNRLFQSRMFQSRMFRNRMGALFAAFNAPRRPRHRILRIALGAIGVALLLALLFVSVFVGIAMLAMGMLWRLWKQRGKPIARARSIDGDYRVLGKTQLPLAR